MLSSMGTTAPNSSRSERVNKSQPQRTPQDLSARSGTHHKYHTPTPPDSGLAPPSTRCWGGAEREFRTAT
jgi:hypothetical protein